MLSCKTHTTMTQKLAAIAQMTLHVNELYGVLEARAGEIALIRKLPLYHL